MPSPIDTLKSRIAAATNDNQLTVDETNEIISIAKGGGGITPAERRELRELTVFHDSIFEAPAKARLSSFISSEMPSLMLETERTADGRQRRNLDDPNTLAEHLAIAKYAWTDGALFKNGVVEDDVIQGAISNCYMVAAFAAVAAQTPEDIEKSIKDNGDGTYTVTFKEVWGFDAPEEVKVTVDGQLPMRDGKILYGKNRDLSELWVGVLEKAFAQWKGTASMYGAPGDDGDYAGPTMPKEIVDGGNYDSVGNGGTAGQVMTAITGRRNREFAATNAEPTQLFNDLKGALASKQAVVAATYGTAESARYTGTGLYAHHAYSVHGTSVEDGKMFIHLRNPWGRSEPSGDGVDDGSFKLEIEKFIQLYEMISIA